MFTGVGITGLNTIRREFLVWREFLGSALQEFKQNRKIHFRPVAILVVIVM